MLLATPAALSPRAAPALPDAALALLNGYQRDFPLVTRPFARLGRETGQSERAVLDRLAGWIADGTVSRVGPVFSPRRVGASTLAALRAPADALERVAALVSAHAEVNHNYAREHDWNLWFVVTAPDAVALARVLREIRRDTGCPVIALPLRAEYHIDLGFDLIHGRRAVSAAPQRVVQAVELSAAQTQLVAALQGGLPLVTRPFARLAQQAGLGEGAVLEQLHAWLDSGVLKRFGVVVRHHELGYRANAMCVWNVPDTAVDALGARLAAADGVNLCYRRERAGTDWPYNLYCMIHGHDRASVQARLDAIRQDCGLDGYPASVLFSTRRFKQCGARYAREAVHG
ncbi:Lrp/AsnC family transcriptional regulator [Nitrogeniibacter mangrovi]|uniref:siroheme decarboxylase n=1 Tax=Nitrogeniibacter mangrovi TaxID=2016596 RepID=A0A6C1B5V1_9RHOO|nr:Lrp/AsnC family transcriptional regulator [Nitrogeniibacter mangrovi]QID19106.1 Lrp/AsnC family transcriptional regulator [Nitrogeniibacter mangrovi]